MTILALRVSRHANGVSKLHGEVSRALWKDVWAGVPGHEVPITSITNGIHTKTWMAPEFSALYTKYLGDWEEHLTEPDFWRARDRYSRRAALGNAPETETAPGRVCAGAGPRGARARRRIAGIDPQRQSHSRSGNSDDRFRPPLRDLQTRRACYSAIRSGLQRLLNDDDASGAIHLRRQIASAAMKAAKRSSSRFTNSAAKPGSRTGSSSSRITTPTLRAGSSRASIFG